ncbi:hypothetical protein [Dactylosporangium sp. CA-233914]|uniref:hypothetical protein n=1 Tax=Dactylosporangium sp. CA-233914 TaxID=3239934 RepID=UPI003D89F86B
MQSRQQRIRRRRDSARAWVRSGAKVTVHSYAKRFDVDRYTAYDDLTALGVTLPGSARRWAQRPSSNPRHVAGGGDGPVENSWIMLDGRRFFVAGFTSGGVPYGIFEDEIDQMESGHLDEDELLYENVENERELGDFRAVDDDCPF